MLRITMPRNGGISCSLLPTDLTPPFAVAETPCSSVSIRERKTFPPEFGPILPGRSAQVWRRLPRLMGGSAAG